MGYVHHPKACVTNENIRLYAGQTVDQCKALCNAEGASCKGFEFGVDHGGDATKYAVGDCQLSSSDDLTGCDGSHHNLDFYERVASSGGDSTSAGHSTNAASCPTDHPGHPANEDPSCCVFMEVHGQEAFEGVLSAMEWWSQNGCQFPYDQQRYAVTHTRNDPSFQKCLSLGHDGGSMTEDDCEQLAKDYPIAHVQTFEGLVEHVNWWKDQGCSFPHHKDRQDAHQMYYDIEFLECMNIHSGKAPLGDDH